jgi:hypothetical protein
MLVRRQKNCASPERCISSEGRGFLTAEGNPAEPPVIKFVASPHHFYMNTQESVHRNKLAELKY